MFFRGAGRCLRRKPFILEYHTSEIGLFCEKGLVPLEMLEGEESLCLQGLRHISAWRLQAWEGDGAKEKQARGGTWVLSELWVLLEKADVKISAFSFILFILIFGYLW